jgi:hypothetical protein
MIILLIIILHCLRPSEASPKTEIQKGVWDGKELRQVSKEVREGQVVNKRPSPGK